MSAIPANVLKDRVLIIHLEDNPNDRELVTAMLAAGDIDCEIIPAEDHKTFQEALDRVDAKLIISDFTMPGYSGVMALQLARQIRSSVPFIFFSGTLGEEAAIESLKKGATDYVLKQHPERLVTAVRRALIEVSERAARRHAETELRQRDMLLRLIMESVEDLITVVDFDGHRMLSSPSHRKFFGDKLPEAGSSFLTEVHPEDREHVQYAFRQTIAAGAGRRIEYRLLLNDGGIRFMEAQGSVIRHSPQEEYVLWMSHDITERKHAEAKIMEQAALLDEAHDAICVNDLDQNILFWNKGAERLYGWAAHEAINRNANELLFQDEVALTALKNLIQRGEWHGELQQTTRSGERLIVASRWALIRDAHAVPKSILVINTNITERKLAEEKIQEQAALLDKAQDAIFVRDLPGEITYWNEGAARLYGWSPQEVTGRNADTILFAKQSPARIEAQGLVFDKGEWSGELRQVTKTGKEVIVESRQTLVRNESGEPSSILVINSDITEKKQIEAQFLRTQRMENLGALAGGIAHDLNNILAPIMLAVEIIQEDPAGEANVRLLETIASSAVRGSELVKQILSFARGVTGERTPLQLRDVVSEVVKLIGDTFPRAIILHDKVPGGLPAIFGDSTQLHQVLLNLCVNARDAMPNGGSLAISASLATISNRETPMQPEPLSGNFVELKVSDTGTGIPKDMQARIFEPFFTTKEHGKGTGLGLSTVMSIAKSHGGFVEVESCLGEGTTFLIYFPVAENAVSLREEKTPCKPGQGKGEQILIVDDEAAIVEIVRTTLRAYNYRVIIASNGAEAIDIFARRHSEIDAVMTDMMMPSMGGVALVDALRKIKSSIPVIAVSGYADKGGMKSLEQNNVRAFLQKPFSTVKLLSALRSVLDAK